MSHLKHLGKGFTLITRLERHWKIPLIATYTGSIYVYTVLSSNRSLLNLSMIIIISTLGYALYTIWKNYNVKERNHLFYRIALFAVFLHTLTLAVNYFFQGLIGFLVGIFIIYYYFVKVIK